MITVTGGPGICHRLKAACRHMRASAAKDGEQLKDLALGGLDSEEASRPRADDGRQLGGVKSVSDQRGGGGLEPTAKGSRGNRSPREAGKAGRKGPVDDREATCSIRKDERKGGRVPHLGPPASRKRPGQREVLRSSGLTQVT